jgi:hypothetical protein
MNTKPYPTCGAKNRQGLPCQRAPLKGRTRCAHHGGKTPKNQNAGTANQSHKHGIYTAGLTEEEQGLWADIRVGQLDEQIRMCHIQLRRAFLAQAKADIDVHAAMELSEVRTTEFGSQSVTRRTDFTALIDRFLGRLGQLEKTRAELIAADNTTDDKLPLPWVD